MDEETKKSILSLMSAGEVLEYLDLTQDEEMRVLDLVEDKILDAWEDLSDILGFYNGASA